MTDTPRDPRIDDLRAQLKALGYLDAGVDRFVLQPARSARAPLTIAGLASLRVGAIAALLLGPATAAGIGARLPGIVTGARDAVVIALYLGAIFGVALTAFTFLISALIARFVPEARTINARRTSRAAGGLVAGACLAYLTLWWRSANAEVVLASPGWTALALAVAVTISLLLGHGVAITTFAVMASRHPLRDADAAGPAPSWRLVPVAGMLAFCGAAALLLLTTPGTAPGIDRPSLPVVSAGLRVTFVALDGFDPEVFDSLRQAGRLSTFTQLIGTASARFPADDTRDPARAWTTIATGQPPEVHGVHALETRRVAGLQGAVATSDQQGLRRVIRGGTDLLRLTTPAVASGAELQAKPIWEVAADAGLRAAVVNWWATWPAGDGGNDGPMVVSDRATLRLERGGTLDAEIAPPQLYEKLQSQWSEIKAAAAQRAATLAPAGDAHTHAALRRSAELDALQLVLAKRLAADAPDLLAIYLPGLDIAQHTLLAPAAGSAPSALAARLEALRSYYVYLDAQLKEIADGRQNEAIVLVTQPGRLTAAAQGILSISGAIRGGAGPVSARAADVAPTVLHVLGIPVSRELAGRPVGDLFDTAFLQRYPIREVPTYGRRTMEPARRGDPLDEEAIERLRSLGYVR